MNRKQKIAIVVGAVVITLLVLFPPWRPAEQTTGKPQDCLRIRWIDDDPRFRFIGADPSPESRIVVHDLVWADTGERVRDTSDHPHALREAMSSVGEKALLKQDTMVAPIPMKVDLRWMAALLTIVFALTTATVLLLKDRKP